MAHGLFDKAREGFLCGEIDWLSHTIKAAMIDSTVRQPNLRTDRVLADLGAAVVSDSALLTEKTAKDGLASAGPCVIQGIDAETVDHIVIFQDTGSKATSRLIAVIDRLGAGKFPFSPQGGDIHISWDAGTTIFKL